MGDRDRLQHLTACPGELLKVTEREKDTYGGRRRQDRERDIHRRKRVLKIYIYIYLTD